MKATHVLLGGFAFAAGVHLSTNVEAACVTNELDSERDRTIELDACGVGRSPVQH